MLIYSKRISETAAAGTFSANTLKVVAGILKQIIVESATTTTTFDVTITNPWGLIVYKTEFAVTGKLHDTVEIPLDGIYTVTINNSSANEAFKSELVIAEGLG